MTAHSPTTEPPGVAEDSPPASGITTHQDVAEDGADESAEPSRTTDAIDDGATEAGVDPQDPPEAFAAVTVATPHDEDQKAKVRFEVFPIERRGKLAVLTFAVTPTLRGDAGTTPSLFSVMGNNGFRPTLIDPVHLKQHKVVTADGADLATDVSNAEVATGHRTYLYAVFAAPAKDVGTVNVNVYDGVPTFQNVPVR